MHGRKQAHSFLKHQGPLGALGLLEKKGEHTTSV
jgi:hypothetical protein